MVGNWRKLGRKFFLLNFFLIYNFFLKYIFKFLFEPNNKKILFSLLFLSFSISFFFLIKPNIAFMIHTTMLISHYHQIYSRDHLIVGQKFNNNKISVVSLCLKIENDIYLWTCSKGGEVGTILVDLSRGKSEEDWICDRSWSSSRS